MDWEKPPLQCLIYPNSFLDNPALVEATLRRNGDPNSVMFSNNQSSPSPASSDKKSKVAPSNTNSSQYEHLLKMIKDSGRSHMKPYEDRVFEPKVFSGNDPIDFSHQAQATTTLSSTANRVNGSGNRSVRSKYKIKEGGKTVFGQAYYRHCHQQRVLPLSSIWNHELESQEHLYIEADRLGRPMDWEPIFKAMRPAEKGGGCENLHGIWIGSVWMDAWRYKEYLESMKRGRLNRSSTSGSLTDKTGNNTASGKPIATSSNPKHVSKKGMFDSPIPLPNTGPDWDEKMSAILANQRLVHLTSSIPSLSSVQLQGKLAKSLGDCVRNCPNLDSIMLCGLGALGPVFMQSFARSLSASNDFSKLTSLSLCRCEIGDEGFKKLLPFIKNSSSLRWLDLSQCQLSDISGDLLIELIRVQTIKFHTQAWQRSLRIFGPNNPKDAIKPSVISPKTGKPIRLKKHCAFIARIEPGTVGLQRLNLCCNGLTDEFLDQVQDLLREPVLLHALDLQFNNFSATKTKTFVDWIVKEAGLGKIDIMLIDLRNNRGMGPKYSAKLVDALDMRRLEYYSRFPDTVPCWPWLPLTDPLEYSYWSYKPSLFERESQEMEEKAGANGAARRHLEATEQGISLKAKSQSADDHGHNRKPPRKAWMPASFYPKSLKISDTRMVKDEKKEFVEKVVKINKFFEKVVIDKVMKRRSRSNSPSRTPVITAKSIDTKVNSGGKSEEIPPETNLERQASPMALIQEINAQIEQVEEERQRTISTGNDRSFLHYVMKNEGFGKS